MTINLAPTFPTTQLSTTGWVNPFLQINYASVRMVRNPYVD